MGLPVDRVFPGHHYRYFCTYFSHPEFFVETHSFHFGSILNISHTFQSFHTYTGNKSEVFQSLHKLNPHPEFLHLPFTFPLGTGSTTASGIPPDVYPPGTQSLLAAVSFPVAILKFF
jgi:hypothetical protein